VAHSDGTLNRLGRNERLQVLEASGTSPNADAVGTEYGETGRVVPAILQGTQASQNVASCRFVT
jgi:hypothetical protein